VDIAYNVKSHVGFMCQRLVDNNARNNKALAITRASVAGRNAFIMPATAINHTRCSRHSHVIAGYDLETT